MQYLKDRINHFVDDSSIEVETNDRNVLLKLKSDSNLGFLIGKKGEMIKNIEFLLSRIASKENSETHRQNKKQANIKMIRTEISETTK